MIHNTFSVGAPYKKRNQGKKTYQCVVRTYVRAFKLVTGLQIVAVQLKKSTHIE